MIYYIYKQFLSTQAALDRRQGISQHFLIYFASIHTTFIVCNMWAPPRQSVRPTALLMNTRLAVRGDQLAPTAVAQTNYSEQRFLTCALLPVCACTKHQHFFQFACESIKVAWFVLIIWRIRVPPLATRTLWEQRRR
jgi:hypothetical protein